MTTSLKQDKWRLFWAIEMPDEVRRLLAELQQSLKKSGADVRMVRPRSIHLTLKFLGDVQTNRIPDLVTAIGPAAGACPRLRLQPFTLGAFPRPLQPRVIWAGLRGDLEPLGRLAGSINSGLTELGFEAETRPFQPHLTLGRVKSGRNKASLIKAMAGLAQFEGPTFTATELILFRSILSPAGAQYSVVQSLKLGG